MFFETNKIKSKNFFVLCDAVANTSPSTRKTIKEHTSLSYPTISRAIEELLDIGILKERFDGKGYTYSLSDKYFFTIADVRDSFRTVFTDLGGKKLSSFDFKESSAFFFDEKLSLFLRNTATIQAKHFTKNACSGFALLLPCVFEPYRDTRGILSSRERLEKLVSSYFPGQTVLLTSAIDAAAELCTQKKAIIIANECSGVILRIVGYGSDRITRLRSLRSTSFTNFKSTAELAREVAYSVGNLCSTLSPDEILIDGSGLFGISTFPKHFKSALALFNCVSEDGISCVRHYRGDAAVHGAVRLLRNAFIDKLIKQNYGES